MDTRNDATFMHYCASQVKSLSDSIKHILCVQVKASKVGHIKNKQLNVHVVYGCVCCYSVQPRLFIMSDLIQHVIVTTSQIVFV